LAYQPPANSAFLSQQTSHQQSASSTFLSEQTSHQPPAKRTNHNLQAFSVNTCNEQQTLTEAILYEVCNELWVVWGGWIG
jgi:hypothetical protein